MIYAHSELKPCLVIQFEFCDQMVENAKMTVVRVNGDMRNEVVIDVENPGFKITGDSITNSGAYVLTRSDQLLPIVITFVKEDLLL